jgi:hypothetical protein
VSVCPGGDRAGLQYACISRHIASELVAIRSAAKQTSVLAAVIRRDGLISMVIEMMSMHTNAGMMERRAAGFRRGGTSVGSPHGRFVVIRVSEDGDMRR